MALRSAIENARQTSRLGVVWLDKFDRLCVCYDATDAECLNIHFYKNLRKEELEYGLQMYRKFEQRKEDAGIFGILDKHLAVQKKSGKIDTWNDRKLEGGMQLHEEIDKKLVEADLIILLLSADFFASDYCYGTEMTKALELHQSGKNVIIPVIVRDCDWLDSPLKNIVALPKDGKPINKWDDKDEAYMDVVSGIKKAIERLI